MFRYCFPGATRVVYGEGMPIYRNPFEKGNLYVKFEITFPPNNFTTPENLAVSIYFVMFQLFQNSSCDANITDLSTSPDSLKSYSLCNAGATLFLTYILAV